jgi:hypothetical protein
MTNMDELSSTAFLESKVPSPAYKMSSSRTVSTEDLSIPGANFKNHSPIKIPVPKRHMMARRNALISRVSLPVDTHTIDKDSSPSRKFRRRHAMCGSPGTIRDIRAAIQQCNASKENKKIGFSPSRTDVLFDQNWRSLSDYEGNHNFKIWLHFAFDGMYQFANSTHRSVITLSILDDLKSKNFRFYMRTAVNGLIEVHEVDDSNVVKLIKRDLESKRRLAQRSFTAKSA